MYSLTTNLKNNDYKSTKQNKNNNKTNFKGVGSAMMNASGYAMNFIEKGGFVTSFLIQDTLGMTAPRTGKGLFRDRDKKTTKFKDLNFKEAAEVFIREFFSGMLMMLTPFVAFALTKKFISKTSTTNTDLLKRVGKNFTSVVKGATKGVSAPTEHTIKKGFYKKSLKQMIENTLPSAPKKSKNKFVNKAMNNLLQMDNLENKLKNAKGLGFKDRLLNPFRKNKVISEKSAIKQQLQQLENNITKDFNNILTTHSTDFSMTDKVKIDGETFRSSDAVKAMRSYIKDASKSKNLAEFTEENAKNLEKSTMARRIFSTVAASLGVIGSTSIVPKVYSLLNPVAPGAMTASSSQTNTTGQKQETSKTDNNKKGQVQFKGNPLKQLQFDRNQLTPLLMSVITLGGLIGPRIRAAEKRAPIDDVTGEKNLIEIPEILTRDVTSVGTVILGVPVISKVAVNSYKKNSGFVLMDKPKETTSTLKKVLEFINPFSKTQPYANSQIESIYGGINTKEKLINFTEFVDKNDGNLVKIFKTLKNGESTFKDSVADFSKISSLDAKAANEKIKEVVKTFDNEKVGKLMEAAVSRKGKVKPNGMVIKAKGLNSMPKFVSTFILVPAFLGLILPKIVYGVTAKNRKKLEEKRNNILSTRNDIPVKNNKITLKKEPLKVKTKGTTFENISKHNVK